MQENSITGANLGKYAVNEREHIVDQRPYFLRITDALRDYKTAKKIVLICFVLMCVLSFIPFVLELFLFIIFPFIWFFAIRDLKTRVYDFPSMVPKASDRNDGSLSLSDDEDNKKGLGNLFFGFLKSEEGKTHYPIVSSFLNGIKHIILSGTTNSGKTEVLYSIFFNAILTQNGLHFVDGKGALDAYFRIFELARKYGRDDDLLLTNFKVDKTGSVYDKKKLRPMSNSYDIFRTQSPNTLNETLRSFLDGAGEGKGDFWLGRAASLISALTRPLMYLAEKGYENLTIQTFTSYMSVDKIEELLFDKTRQYGAEFSETTKPLMEFMVSIHPQYSEAMRGQLPFDSLKQFMFASMQLNRTQSEFTYNFGPIFDILVGDIEPKDVVRNKRIWVSILPSVENSFTTMKLLGRMQLEAGRQALAAMMVGSPSGNKRKILYEMNQMSNRWFVDGYDEFAYFGTDGTSILPAQGRAYGMCMVFSLQELESLYRLGSEESVEMVSNTAIKIFMRTAAAENSKSWELIKGFVGSIEVKAYARLKGGRRLFRRQEVSTEQKLMSIPRATYKEVSSFEQGEMLFIYPKRIQNTSPDAGVIHGRSLYIPARTGKEALKTVTVHQLLPTEPYVKSQISRITYRKTRNILELLGAGKVSSALGTNIDIESPIEKKIAEFTRNRKNTAVYSGEDATDMDLLREFILYFNNKRSDEVEKLRQKVKVGIEDWALQKEGI